jgi:hypothetical protein
MLCLCRKLAEVSQTWIGMQVLGKVSAIGTFFLKVT